MLFRKFLKDQLYRVDLKAYRDSIPEKVRTMRNKKHINVLFVVTDITYWKTEELYKAMLCHPRFNPSIGIASNLECYPSQNVFNLKLLHSYLHDKGYSYEELTCFGIEKMHPDIIFYEKPYETCIDHTLSFHCNKTALFCYALYGFNSISEAWSYTQPLQDHCWHIYYENEIPKAYSKKFSRLKGKNCRVTGLPFQDRLLTPKENLKDPWKPSIPKRKRIIYAPHHSIGDQNYLGFSTFLENAQVMLDMARKYSGSVQFVFKPHPVLKTRLNELWGSEKTEDYYNQWAVMENSQIQQGEYLGLFKYSDAMIHDCCSFQIEYHYTKNPVLYLIRDNDEAKHKSKLNEFGQMAFDLHYKGSTAEDIEKFIDNVIDGTDIRRKEREAFFDNYLLPPHGKTACENIIAEILEGEI